MNYPLLIILIVSALYSLFALFIALGRRKRKVVSGTDKRISLIVPARNEEKDLPRVLSSIAELDYPQDLLEVILVDHKSTDGTLKMMREFASSNPFKTIVVSAETRDCKADALRAGIAVSSGDYLAFTDAEAKFDDYWLKSMAESAAENTLAGGPVIIEGDDFFARMQRLDWLYLFSAGAGFAGWKIPQSVFGKNMLIDRKLFDSAGGFPNGMVWTEDLELAARCKNFGKVTLFPDLMCAVYSVPEKKPASFYRQKLRWLKGSEKVDFWGMFAMITALAMNLTVLFAAFTSIACFFLAWMLKSLGDMMVLTGMLEKLNQRKDIWLIPFYSLFSTIYQIVLLMIYPLAQKPRWRQ